MSTETKSPWKKRRARRNTNFDEKREALFEAAARLFLENGYENTSLVDLADELNIRKPTLYYYIKSKDDMLLEIKRGAQSDIIDAIEEIESEGGSGAEKLEKYIWAHLRVMSSDAGRCLVTIRRASLEPGSRAKLEKHLANADNRVMAFLEEGISDGTIKKYANPRQAYHHMVGSLNWFAVWYRPEGPMKLDDVIEEHVRLIFEGLKA